MRFLEQQARGLTTPAQTCNITVSGESKGTHDTRLLEGYTQTKNTKQKEQQQKTVGALAIMGQSTKKHSKQQNKQTKAEETSQVQEEKGTVGTPRRTTGVVEHLDENKIFVFGSNEAGIHGKGAARTARRWGAILGQAEGLQGQTYGIPTKDKHVRKSLNLTKIDKYVSRFIVCAAENPQYTFLVTEIGCGLSGYNPADIAPLFRQAMAVENIHLPESFWQQLA